MDEGIIEESLQQCGKMMGPFSVFRLSANINKYGLFFLLSKPYNYCQINLR